VPERQDAEPKVLHQQVRADVALHLGAAARKDAECRLALADAAHHQVQEVSVQEQRPEAHSWSCDPEAESALEEESLVLSVPSRMRAAAARQEAAPARCCASRQRETQGP